MLIPGMVRLLTSRTTRTVAISLALVFAAVGPAQPAFAFEGCPLTGGQPSPHEGLNYWNTNFPNEPVGTPEYEAQASAGVTVCVGTDIDDPTEPGLAYVQIIDLADGAKLRLQSERDPNQAVPESDADWTFTKKRIFEWFGDIFWDPSNNPDGNLLFSTTNASFFTDTSSNPTTALSLPEKSSAFLRSLGVALHGSDPAWNALKRYLKLGPPDTSGQQVVEIGSFPTHYSEQDVASTFEGAYDGTVGFEPLYGPSQAARRTMLGFAGSKVYILTTDQPYTLEDAQEILQYFNPAVISIQLDGGGSTSFYSAWSQNWVDSFVAREVPDVLGVYFGPGICNHPYWAAFPVCSL